jgi:SAM-dependent methyltransferase
MTRLLDHLRGGSQELADVEWNQAHWGNFEANLDFLDRTAALRSPMSVLEIGCGKGAMLSHLQDKGHRVVGMDLDPRPVHEARAERGGLPVLVAHGTALPFGDGAFDIVLSFDVFEHIADSDAHLSEVRRVLRPGGAYLLQTPNKWTNMLFEPIRFTRKFGLRHAFRFLEDHCALHNYWQLLRRLRLNGFDPRYCDVPVVNDFFRRKVRRFMGPLGVRLLRVVNPDRFPLPLRTNFYVQARRP